MVDQLWDIDVEVMPKAGVNDPAGEAILGGLGMLGYSEVRKVRSGKSIRLVLAAPDEATAANRASEMADRLLANPVIEVFDVRVVGPAKETAPR
ncbi:MAG: phosphoribosylformylglycinamidine synthase subunit PurS [Thermomicrobiales bacterium]|nr:phosphoribosylformylglycinamidine synthase subunit PurS [Thermomicrobiales bacterium]